MQDPGRINGNGLNGCKACALVMNVDSNISIFTRWSCAWKQGRLLMDFARSWVAVLRTLRKKGVN